MTHRCALALLFIAACTTPIVQTTTPVGERHAGTVFTHCGFYEVDFADRRWTPSSIERGAMPEGTDSMATDGTFELMGTDELLFRADSGLEVRYRPAPADREPVPGCD